MKRFRAAAFAGFIAIAAFATVSAHQSFRTSKNVFMTQVYNTQENRQTLYCGCEFDAPLAVSFLECGFEPSEKYFARARRVEWEHVVPASWFGQRLPCWTDKSLCGGRPGRACCGRIDKSYIALEGDMHNLYPAIGQINALRSNKPYGYVPGAKREFGLCDIKIEKNVVEVAPAVMGKVARASLYIDDRHKEIYGKRLFSSAVRATFILWSVAWPADEWEIERNEIVGKIQGNKNPYITGRPETNGRN